MSTKSFTRNLKFKTDKEVAGLIKTLENDKVPNISNIKIKKASKKRILEILGKK